MTKIRQTLLVAKDWQCQVACRKYKKCRRFRLCNVRFDQNLFSIIWRAWMVGKSKEHMVEGRTHASTLLIINWLKNRVYVICVYRYLAALQMKNSILINFLKRWKITTQVHLKIICCNWTVEGMEKYQETKGLVINVSLCILMIDRHRYRYRID